jgi:hypothetical protein
MGAAKAAARRQDAQRRGVTLSMFVLVSWACYTLGVTVLLGSVIVWIVLNQEKLKRSPDIFDRMPDLEGDSPGVKKVSSGTYIRYKPFPDGRRPDTYGGKTVTRPLPERLLVDLGQKIEIGDLEVTPLKVERKRKGELQMFLEGYKDPAPVDYDALVLTLRIRNISTDNAFAPLDNYFDRRWKDGEGRPPLTVLVAGERRFFGGPARWFSRESKSARRSRGPEFLRQWIEGRKDEPQVLEPGKEMVTCVASNGEDRDVARYLFGAQDGGKRAQAYSGPLLWRVHLRRGLIGWRGKEVPATAVIGVRFTDKDYKKG